jgi:hypothetical protein
MNSRETGGHVLNLPFSFPKENHGRGDINIGMHFPDSGRYEKYFSIHKIFVYLRIQYFT